MSTRMDSFERAFDTHGGGCQRECECGRTFYDAYGSYDWEPGEMQDLQNDPKATPLDYSVSTIVFEGTEYCVDCDCWRPRAEKIMDWLDAHARRIAEYLTLEKKRKQEIADNSPVVEDRDP